jgi:uncharacterized protein DUF4203
MNDYAWAAQISAPLAIVAGILICFWGYRILKFTLAVVGFIVGAYGGWQFGLSLAHDSTGIALVCALVGGLVGAALCLWLYFLGIFLVGAAAGTVVASAFFNGTGHQPQPIVLLAAPIIFGVIALLAQRFMFILSTAFSGSYLIIAGFWPYVAGSQIPSRIWLHPTQSSASGILGYAALGLWIVLGLAGASFQFRGSRQKVEVETQQHAQ